MTLIIPETVSVKAGLARGASAVRTLEIVVAWLASLFNVKADSLTVFSAAGAAHTRSVIF